MTEFDKQQVIITAMYKRLGSDRDGDFVTVGFSKRKKEEPVSCVNHNRKVDSEFFNFNNVLSNFM